MKYKWVTLPIYFLALMYIAGAYFIKPHLLAFEGPGSVKHFSNYPNCERNIEALVIAAEGSPFVYENADFGLGKAIQSLRSDTCNGIPPRYLADDYVTSLQNWGTQKAQRHMESQPSALLYDQSHWRLPKGYYPRWPLGDAWLLISNYSDLYSGHGIKHYFRCDYSLNLQPYHSFILSKMHNESVAQSTIERIHECGFSAEFQMKIDSLIATSPVLPPIFQD